MAKSNRSPGAGGQCTQGEPQAEPTLEQWRAYAGDLQRQLTDAQAVVAGYEARAPKATYCFSPPGAAIAWRIPAVSLDRARAALPAEAAGAMYRGVA